MFDTADQAPKDRQLDVTNSGVIFGVLHQLHTKLDNKSYNL